jgi:hypothetical protein
VAHADPKQLTADAEALVAKGDMLGAAAKYRAAFAEEPIPEHVCNAGVAYHKAQDLPRSHRYLNRCVAMGSALDATYRETLRRVVESIEQKLVAGNFTPVDIALQPPTAIVAIDGGKIYDEDIVGGGRIWLPWGAYTLIVRADGYVEKRTDIKPETHDALPLTVTLEKVIVKPPIADKPLVHYADRPRPSKLPAIITTAGSGVLAVAGLVFYLRARDQISKANSTMDLEEFEDHRDKAKTQQHISWGFGGAALVAGGVAGYLWWRVLRDPGRVEITATGNTVGIRGSF